MKKENWLAPNAELYIKATKIYEDVAEKLTEVREYDPERDYDDPRLFMYIRMYPEKFEPSRIGRELDKTVVLVLAMDKLGANILEMTKAVKYMMVLSACQHVMLNWLKSRKDNDIEYLMNRYFYEASLCFLGSFNQ